MSQSQKRLFRAIILISLSSFLNLSAQLKESFNQADYIIISPPQFIESLQPFADWRQSKNFAVEIVNLQQIYSEFPDSTKSNSIREFVSYTLTNWVDPKPSHVLLVGGTNFLPSYKVSSIFSNNPNFDEDSVSIDEWYSVNLNDSDTKPDVSIGRFPISTKQELMNIISKTIFFEDSLVLKDYSTDLIILTDKVDSNAFGWAANQFLNTFQPYDVSYETIFAYQDSTIELSRDRFINGLNNGTLFLSYYGHGAPNRWSEYNLFTLEDVNLLRDNNHPFIFTAVACSQSFDLPIDSSIVNKLILSHQSGSVASISSSGLNFLTSGSKLLTNFYSIIFKNPDVPIGNALLQAKLLNDYNQADDAMERRFSLLGDPALKIPLNIIAEVSFQPQTTPKNYSLGQNYPNPFNPSTKINYSISHGGFITIKVYDIIGQEVATLVNEEIQPGIYNVEFDGTDVSSGVYIYQMRINDFVDVKKFVLTK